MSFILKWNLASSHQVLIDLIGHSPEKVEKLIDNKDIPNESCHELYHPLFITLCTYALRIEDLVSSKILFIWSAYSNFCVQLREPKVATTWYIVLACTFIYTFTLCVQKILLNHYLTSIVKLELRKNIHINFYNTQ